MKQRIGLCVITLALSLAASTRAEAARLSRLTTQLYVYTEGIQADFPWDDADEANVSGSTAVRVEADPVAPHDSPTDGYLLEGISTFGTSEIAITAPDEHHSVVRLAVNNQATDDPAASPWGWGFSKSYAIVTFQIVAEPGESVGDAVVANIDITLNDPRFLPGAGWGVLYAMEPDDEHFLDFGYAVGPSPVDNSTDIAGWTDPDNVPNPAIANLDDYRSWKAMGPPDWDGDATFTMAYPTHTTSVAYSASVGDTFQLVLNLNSFSWMSFGYTWTDGTVVAELSTQPAPPADADGDGVSDDVDLCLDTQLNEKNAPLFPWVKFGTNRQLLVNGVMSQNRKSGEVPGAHDITETGGCSCQQILDACDAAGAKYGNGHYKFGCSTSVLEAWATGVGNAGVSHPAGYRCE